MKILIILFTLLTQAKTFDELKNSCEGSNGADCFDAAYLSAKKGQQVEPLNLYELGCKFKNGKSCYAADKTYKKLGQLKNDNKYLELSCEYGFHLACYEVAELIFSKRLYLEAMDLYEKSCQLKYVKSCKKLEYLKPYFSRVVRSSEKELSKKELSDQTQYLKLLNEAMLSLKKDCQNKDYVKCIKLAESYLFLANVKEARKWSKISCDNKLSEGCLVLGEVEQKEGKTELKSFETACDLENGVGCYRFAQSIEETNLARAMSFYRRSCESKIAPSAKSCSLYAKYQKSNPKMSDKYLKLACSHNIFYCKK